MGGIEMKSRMMLAAALAALVGALLPGAAGAAVSPTYAVAGTEVAATSTQGTFVGAARGSSGDFGVWQAVVVHDPLASTVGTPVAITGGTFTMQTVYSPGPDIVAGTFTGGSVTLVNAGGACGNQVYAVKGSLGNVTTTSSTGGTGSFTAVLTHYRIFLFGACRTYAASVVGTLTLAI
jgi:hypothetical protein